MADNEDSNALLELYRDRIGEPINADEVSGYYVFLVGTLLAALGIAWFLVTAGGSGGPAAREFGYVLAAGGFLLLLGGAVYRLPLAARATYAVYLGGVLSLVGLALFASRFPSGWSVGSPTSNAAILLYAGGIGVMALGTILAPIERFPTPEERRLRGEVEQLRAELSDRDERVATLGEQLEQRETEHEALAEERDDLAERLETAERERDDLEAERSELETTAVAERDAREEAVAKADELGAALATAKEEQEDLEERAAAAEARATTAEDRLARLEASNATFDVYRDKAGKWRWRLVHQNSNIIAASGQGYSNDRGARRGMRSVVRNALGAAVVWQRDEEEPDPEPELVREASRATFELYADDAGEHRFRLRHDNENVIAAAARGFSSRSNATNAVEAVRSYIAPADYLEFDPTGIEVFEDAAGEFRWRLVHRNGRILADSGEGYASRSNARRAVEGFQRTAGDAEVDGESGPRYETYEDAGGEHRWRLVARNDEIIADCGGGYADQGGLHRALDRVREYAPTADTLTVGAAAIEVYEDAGGEFRWRLRHRNGTILATSGEGYADRSGAIDGVNSVKRNAPEAETADGTDDDEAEDAGDDTDATDGAE
jgi:uncharacterized protein YegP (UPF0339 family)